MGAVNKRAEMLTTTDENNGAIIKLPQNRLLQTVSIIGVATARIANVDNTDN